MNYHFLTLAVSMLVAASAVLVTGIRVTSSFAITIRVTVMSCYSRHHRDHPITDAGVPRGPCIPSQQFPCARREAQLEGRAAAQSHSESRAGAGPSQSKD